MKKVIFIISLLLITSSCSKNEDEECLNAKIILIETYNNRIFEVRTNEEAAQLLRDELEHKLSLLSC